MPALRISVGWVVNPVIRGVRYISSMPSRSAPSAKSLTRKPDTMSVFVFIILISFRKSFSQNPCYGVLQGGGLVVRLRPAPRLAIPVINQYRSAPGQRTGGRV